MRRCSVCGNKKPSKNFSSPYSPVCKKCEEKQKSQNRRTRNA